MLKISWEVYQRMLNLYAVSSNPYLNYEYVLMDVTNAIERPFLRFKNFNISFALAL